MYLDPSIGFLNTPPGLSNFNCEKPFREITSSMGIIAPTLLVGVPASRASIADKHNSVWAFRINSDYSVWWESLLSPCFKLCFQIGESFTLPLFYRRLRVFVLFSIPKIESGSVRLTRDIGLEQLIVFFGFYPGTTVVPTLTIARSSPPLEYFSVTVQSSLQATLNDQRVIPQRLVSTFQSL